MRIGNLAKVSGSSVQTIRFYAARGPAPGSAADSR